MKMHLVHILILVLIANCVIVVAKNDTESEKKLDSKLNQSIYAEGLSQNHEEEPKRRIFGRKGVIINANETVSNETSKLPTVNSTHENSSQSSIVDSKNTSVSLPVLKINSTNTHNATSMTNKTNSAEQKTSSIDPVVSANLPSSTVSNTPKLANTSLVSNPVTSTTSSTTTTKLTTKTTTLSTTHKPKKPEITYSADDNPQIRDSEKNINFNVANEKSDELPKVEQDIDRTIIDEKHARSSYMLYLGLVFALPTTFVLINIAYRKIKSYLELRHYTRVDFLVDGMYVS